MTYVEHSEGSKEIRFQDHCTLYIEEDDLFDVFEGEEGVEVIVKSPVINMSERKTKGRGINKIKFEDKDTFDSFIHKLKWQFKKMEGKTTAGEAMNIMRVKAFGINKQLDRIAEKVNRRQ